MKIGSFLPSRRRALVGIAALALLFMSTIAARFAFASRPMSGNTEDAVVQVACGEPNELPVAFTVNYQNGPAWDRDVIYGNNTTPCPPEGGELGFGGQILPGVEGSGNVESITIKGVKVQADGPTVEIPVDGGGGQALRIIRVRVYRYSGSLYVEIWFRF